MYNFKISVAIVEVEISVAIVGDRAFFRAILASQSTPPALDRGLIGSNLSRNHQATYYAVCTTKPRAIMAIT